LLLPRVTDKNLGSIACRGFKALKQQTKLLFLVLRRPHEALQTYTELLTYTKSAVTRNYSERSINGILDYVGDGGKKGKGRKAAEAAKGNEVDVEVLQRFYEVTKASMEDARNDVCPNIELLWWPNGLSSCATQRLSLKTNLKLAKLWLDRREYSRLAKVACFAFDMIFRLYIIVPLSYFVNCINPWRKGHLGTLLIRLVGRSYWRYMLWKFRCTMR
jgi:hypothetical protein